MFLGLETNARGEALADHGIRQFRDGVGELGPGATASTSENFQLLRKAAASIDDGDASRASGLGHSATE